ncbi:hypothetical protein GGI25_005894 [Coemansia spiralis]|uniref:Uncharacterized protein n=2 Tax=Coemansia TaxID=4863 RepID=A0A9W8G3U2_9FUNG|nr:hypothetical protein BX070DRAFT_37771 [Coemansia spiralis]KAJ1989509.1 hypothetical protein EDC05_004625 [Coemansia umbellata]KAJ2670283.1 hypothetical protein GGI25_005894 [Coemansia spiralis]
MQALIRIFYIAILFVMLAVCLLADDADAGNMPATSSPSIVVPFDNLAQNLPEALSALEGQFQDADFKSVLTSQLNNPEAVELFQSLIHDQNAVNSISALLEDPGIQSSLSAQFVQQYLLPTGSGAFADNVHHTQAAEATGDISSHSGKDDIESSLGDIKSHSSTHNGASGRPRALVIGCLLTFLLSAMAPV